MSTTHATSPARRPHRLSVVDPSFRVGDADRERTAARLGQAFTQGYLPMPEYETRVSQAFEAQTADALQRLLTDLPVDRISRRDPHRRQARLAAARRGVQIHLIAYLAMSLLTLMIWLVVAVTVGAWYFWPVWPILGAGIGLASHAIPVHARSRRTTSI